MIKERTKRSMRATLSRKTVGGAIAMAAVAAITVTAVATAGGGFTATPTSRGTLAEEAKAHSGGIRFQTEDRVDVVSGQAFTYDPGGFSGWHTHPGFVLAVVKSGALTVTVGCASHTYSGGQAFYETGTTPIMAMNNGTQNAVVLATYVVPIGSPTRLDANPPTCDRADAHDSDH